MKICEIKKFPNCQLCSSLIYDSGLWDISNIIQKNTRDSKDLNGKDYLVLKNINNLEMHFFGSIYSTVNWSVSSINRNANFDIQQKPKRSK